MRDEVDTDAVAALASDLFDRPVGGFWIKVLSPKIFPWVKVGRIVMATTKDDERDTAHFWVRTGVEPVRLGGPNGAANVSALLVANTGPLPSGLPEVELANAVSRFLGVPQRIIAEPEFLRAAQQNWALWLPEDTPAARKLFAAQCVKPHLARGRDDWTLTFRSFIPNGSVEAWTVTGDAKTITKATHERVVPPGTFLWLMF